MKKLREEFKNTPVGTKWLLNERRKKERKRRERILITKGLIVLVIGLSLLLALVLKIMYFVLDIYTSIRNKVSLPESIDQDAINIAFMISILSLIVAMVLGAVRKSEGQERRK